MGLNWDVLHDHWNAPGSWISNLASISLCDRGHFLDLVLSTTSHWKKCTIVIRIFTQGYLKNWSTIGCIWVRIFNVAKGWVVANVQVSVSMFVQDIETSSVLHNCWLTVLSYPFDFLTIWCTFLSSIWIFLYCRCFMFAVRGDPVLRVQKFQDVETVVMLWSSSPSHRLLVTSGTSHAKILIFLIGLDNQLLFTRGTFPLDRLQISAKLAKLWKLELLDLAVLCKISISNTFYWSNALATCSGMRRWISDWKFHKISFQKLN